MSLAGFDSDHAPELSFRLREIAEEVSAFLSAFNRGRARAIKAPELARAFGLKPQELRACIHYLRTRELVCSDGAGYYIPETRTEAETTCSHLSERAASIQRLADKQRDLLEGRFPLQAAPAHLKRFRARTY